MVGAAAGRPKPDMAFADALAAVCSHQRLWLAGPPGSSAYASVVHGSGMWAR